MKTLSVIMGHADAQATFDRHLPLWKSNGTDLMVMCPQDAVLQTDIPVLALGRKGHHSAMANWRFRQLLEFLTRLRYDWFVVHEYDSICVSPEIPPCPVTAISANLFTADQPEFKGHHFLHPPLQLGPDVLWRILDAMRKLPDDSERGFWDRLIGYACELADVAMVPYGKLGFSKNTIHPEDIPAAVDARKKGAVMYHGVKTEQVLRALTTV